MNKREITLNQILQRHRGTESQAQRTRILTAIQELGSVTTFEASRLLDCYDPRARVKELRRDGHQIAAHMRAVQPECGVFHRIGVYLMAAQESAK